VRKLAPSDGWQTTAEAVARRVVEGEQEDAVEDEEVVREEDLNEENSRQKNNFARPQKFA
jgi:hypothetical protein